MINEQVFTVIGYIKGQPRPRVSVFAGHAHVYESSAGRENKANIRAQVVQQLPKLIGKGVPVRLSVETYLPRPGNHYGTGKYAETLKNSAPHYCSTKPDADNIIKAIKDALKGVCWLDDAQVVDERIVKLYGDAPKTVITVKKFPV